MIHIYIYICIHILHTFAWFSGTPSAPQRNLSLLRHLMNRGCRSFGLTSIYQIFTCSSKFLALHNRSIVERMRQIFIMNLHKYIYILYIYIIKCLYHMCTDALYLYDKHSYTYVHTYISTYIHIYIHPYIHIHIHPYIHIYIHPYIHTSIYTYIHTYIHIYICTYIHIYIYIHT